jgi:DNA end-binding protein Ku
VIDAKVEGQEVVAPAGPSEEGKLIDLMAALEASVAAAKQARAAATEEPVSVAAATSSRQRADDAAPSPEGQDLPRTARKRKTA